LLSDKLKVAEEKYTALSERLASPEAAADNAEFARLMKEYKSLTPLIETYRRYKTAKRDFDEAEALLGDPEMKELARLQFEENKELLEAIEHELKLLLLPKDPDDDRNVIIEVRGGTGGDEAALFANTLYRMYTLYAAEKRWKVEVLSSNETELGGFKEISFLVSGEGAFAKLKYESGVHRVQRVPETEAQGRIHTSAATVAVLPEAEEVDVQINDNDLDITTCRSSGAGGQHINKTESAIRIVHKPTGIAVECQEERSQFKNRDKAMKMLYGKLYERKQRELADIRAADRKGQVGSGDRSERIRTYNFPQSRVTDHRINLTLYKLEAFLNGICDEVFDALRVAEQAAMLSAEND
jgi:peptide chain release factor 1